jgi:hypothetical protein
MPRYSRPERSFGHLAATLRMLRILRQVAPVGPWPIRTSPPPWDWCNGLSTLMGSPACRVWRCKTSTRQVSFSLIPPSSCLLKRPKLAHHHHDITPHSSSWATLVITRADQGSRGKRTRYPGCELAQWPNSKISGTPALVRTLIQNDYPSLQHGLAGALE